MSEIIAKVNKKEIYRQELKNISEGYKKQTNKEKITEEDKKYLLERIIQNYLLIEEAEEQDIKVPEQMLENNLQQYYQAYKGEENFKNMLKTNNIPFDDFKKKLESDLKAQLIINLEVENNVNISDDEMKKYFENNKKKMKTQESVKASHILVSTKEMEENEAKEKIEKISEEVNKDNFSELAKKYSDCPSKENGGDLGFFSKGKMDPVFENAAFDLDIDEISSPVKTNFGYHIIYKKDHNAEKDLQFEDVKDHIKSTITKEKSNKIIGKFIEKLKNKFNVEYLQEFKK